MTENGENLVLELLRTLRSDIQTLRSEMHGEFKDVKQRLSGVESTLVTMKMETAELYAVDKRQQISFDSLVERVQRIERRLDILE